MVDIVFKHVELDDHVHEFHVQVDDRGAMCRLTFLPEETPEFSVDRMSRILYLLADNLSDNYYTKVRAADLEMIRELTTELMNERWKVD